MKLFKTLLFILIICTSCHNKQDSKTSKKESKNTAKAVKNTSNLSVEKENIMEILKTKTPLTKAQFESWLPPSLINMPQTSSTINLIPDMSNCNVFYKTTDKEILLSVTDGAGDKGSDYIKSFIKLNTENYNNQHGNVYEKTKTIHGIRLRESYVKSDGGKYIILMFYNNRFVINIQAKNITHEALEKLIKELNLEKLKNL